VNCVKFNAAATGFQCLLCVEISRCVLLSVSGTTVATLCHLPRPDQLGAGPVAKKIEGPVSFLLGNKYYCLKRNVKVNCVTLYREIHL